MFGVEPYCKVAAFDKVGFWYGWYCDKPGRVGHSFCVGNSTEDGYLVIWCSECFDSLKCLLAIIQCRCHAVYAEIGILDELGLAPFSDPDAVVRFDMAIDCVGRKLRIYATTVSSHMPSRTLKPMLSQSA